MSSVSSRPRDQQDGAADTPTKNGLDSSLQRPGDKAGHEFPGPLPDLAAVAHDQGCHPTEVVTMQPFLKSQIIALV